MFRRTPLIAFRDAAVPVLFVAALATGCTAGGSDTTDTTGTATTSATAPPSASGTTSPSASGSATATTEDMVAVRVRVENGDVSPAPHRVKVDEGQTVRLRVSSDVADEVHVHGVDKSAAVAAGGTATVTFVADQQGVFEVELEDAGLQLLQLQVQ